MGSSPAQPVSAGTVLLSEDDPRDRAALAELRADPGIDVLDTAARQRATLASSSSATDADLLAEPTRWVYFPWRRTVVSILGPRGFRRLRLDRNRNLITTDEQDALGRLRIGVVGLSVGHAIAYGLAAQGMCGELRLADFDELELSNLNRVPASVLDIGLNKALVTARRIAELDPYLPVQVMTDGIDATTIDRFLDGLDIVVEECDSLDVKALLRERARARGLPVLMTTSDRGLLDVERFDLDPARPILHGLLGDIDAAALAGLSSKDKVPYVLRILDAGALSPRMAASLVEVGTTLSTWPQLAGEVGLGATAVAEAVRRIGLGEPLPSGRARIDAPAILTGIEDALLTADRSTAVDEPADTAIPDAIADAVAHAATRAPSGGNVQPWHIEATTDGLELQIAPEHTSAMDVGYRASAVALGAAVYNARVAAAAHSRVGPVSYERGDDDVPLRAVVRLGAGEDTSLAARYEAMLRRETNRRHGSSRPLPDTAVHALQTSALEEGARLVLLTDPAEVSRAARILAEADRIRYLTPRLHAEMISELRWPGDVPPDTGIDVRSLELPASDLVKLDILRRPEVMAELTRWDGGWALGDDSYDRITSSAALAVVVIDGRELADFAQGGSAVEAVWVMAEELGIGVQPVSPVFLYALDERENAALAPRFADRLAELRRSFRTLTDTGPDESQALVLRLSYAPRPTTKSRRRRERSALRP
ncbi:Rv1355c family protein [Mycolicibacterium sp. F2034L]|uniref:Rv1355c family protein n=1 Tax=Mycolicibacterium sp. F2034L TaxID=2926422 RepID=UPI001FF58265|nr:Rv1355c family protein [Mycolicibacterium sp. F2034L]MCK0174854.1 Rv1355c family protein [Mycolicibacterium sp. F2034L]